MQAAQILEPGQTRVIDAPQPIPGPDDVLIRVQAAGICGTDIHILRGEYEAHYPIIPGHEFSGEVAAVGGHVTRFKPGERVTADPNIPCNRCPACQQNRPNQCEHLQAVGVTRSGAFAEYVLAPEGNVYPIGGMSYAAAALVEPLACVVWGLQRVDVQPGDRALVFGAGPMGCLMLQALRSAGAAHVAMVDRVPGRLALAGSLGAAAVVQTEDAARLGKDFDIVADATGLPAVLEGCFDYVRPRGKVWVFGVCPPGEKACFLPYEVFRRDLSIIGSFAVNRTFRESIALIDSGAVQVEPLISHRLPLADFAAGMEIAERAPDRMKVQFTLA